MSYSSNYQLNQRVSNLEYEMKQIDPSLNEVVTLAGAQTITGVKTFSALPQSSVAPTTSTDLTNKAYVDSAIGVAQDLTSVLGVGNSAGTYNIDMSGNEIVNVANIVAQTGQPFNIRTGDNTDQLAMNSSGVITFTSSPLCGAVPSTNNELVNKLYVDTAISVSTPALSAVLTAGNSAGASNIDMSGNSVINVSTLKAQTGQALNIATGDGTNQAVMSSSGIVAFTNLPTCSSVPSSGSQLVNKTYVDGAIPATPSLGSVMAVGNVASTTLDLSGNQLINCNYIASVGGANMYLVSGSGQIQTSGSSLSVGSGTLTGAILNGSGSANLNINAPGANSMVFQTNSTTALTLSSSQIGTWTNLPVCSAVPSSGSQLVNKTYADGLKSQATAISITDSNTNATFYPTFVSATGASQTVYVDSSTTPFSYNPNTGAFLTPLIAVNSTAVSIGNSSTIALANNSVCIGPSAGGATAGSRSTMIGVQCGTTFTGSNGVGLGDRCLNSGSGATCTAIGTQSLYSNANNSACAFGYFAGYDSAGQGSCSFGSNAGQQSLGAFGIAFGNTAGRYAAGAYSVAIGYNSGTGVSGGTAHGSNAVAIGYNSCNIGSGASSIGIGNGAGASGLLGSSAIAIGTNSASAGSGNYAICIGALAGQTTAQANSIVINAMGTTAINTTGTSRCFIAPIRGQALGIGVGVMYYDPATYEVSYSTT